jgi:hypothetical protein
MRMIPVRASCLFLLCCMPLATYAEKSTPDNLQPLAPPPAMENAPENEPEVTITKRTEQTIEEYRVGGKLYMIKVTPKVGPPYYLVDDQGDGKFSRQESLDSGFRPPRWVIRRF